MVACQRYKRISHGRSSFILTNFQYCILSFDTLHFQNDAIPAPEVPVAILEHRLEKATSPKEKMQIEMKLMSVLRVSLPTQSNQVSYAWPPSGARLGKNVVVAMFSSSQYV